MRWWSQVVLFFGRCPSSWGAAAKSTSHIFRLTTKFARSNSAHGHIRACRLIWSTHPTKVCFVNETPKSSNKYDFYVAGDLTNYVTSGEWKLKSIKAVRHVEFYPCCPNEVNIWPIIQLYIGTIYLLLTAISWCHIWHLHKKTNPLFSIQHYYTMCLALGAKFNRILAATKFWLVFSNLFMTNFLQKFNQKFLILGEKITLGIKKFKQIQHNTKKIKLFYNWKGITVLLAFSVFMLLIAESIPATSETVPLIVIYLTTSMSLTSLSIISTVLLFQLHHAGRYSPVMSRGFYTFVTRKIGCIVGLSSLVKQYEQEFYKNTQSKLFSHDPQNHNKVITKNQFLNSFKEHKQKKFYESNINLYTKPFYPDDFSSSSRMKQHLIDDSYLNSKCSAGNAKKLQSNYKSKTLSTNNNGHSNLNASRRLATFSSFHYDQDLNSDEEDDLNQSKTILSQSKACGKCAGSGSASNCHSEHVIKSLKKINNNVKILINKSNELNTRSINEWKLVALIIDRLVFWLFALVTMCSSIFLLIILPILKHRDFIWKYFS